MKAREVAVLLMHAPDAEVMWAPSRGQAPLPVLLPHVSLNNEANAWMLQQPAEPSESNPMQYLIISSPDISQLIKDVNSAIQIGWRPLGGPLYGERYFYQAMTR